MKKKVSVILPTYNEKYNIEELIMQVYFYTGRDLLEIIVVDDNSPDGTWRIVKKLQKKYKSLRLIRRMRERGLPSAIWRGIKESRGNIVLWLDCDLSHPPHLIPKMLGYMPDYDIVSASRYVKGGKDQRNFYRVFTSRILNILGNIFLRLGVKDLTSGFFAVKGQLFKRIKIKQEGYAEYCIRFTYDAIKGGFKWKEVPYAFIDRKKGSSKAYINILNFIKNGYLCFKEIIRLKFSE